jgi:hypothetical protein
MCSEEVSISQKKAPSSKKEKKKCVKCLFRSPRLSVDDKMIPEFRKALVAVSDSPFERQFLNRQLSECQLSLTHGAVSKSTNIHYSDFCKLLGRRKKLVTLSVKSV